MATVLSQQLNKISLAIGKAAGGTQEAPVSVRYGAREAANTDTQTIYSNALHGEYHCPLKPTVGGVKIARPVEKSQFSAQNTLRPINIFCLLGLLLSCFALPIILHVCNLDPYKVDHFEILIYFCPGEIIC